jgi:hypothetical protein
VHVNELNLLAGAKQKIDLQLGKVARLIRSSMDKNYSIIAMHPFRNESKPNGKELSI